MALEYFPDSLLSRPADLNATFMESGRFISGVEQQGLPSSSLTLAGESSSSSSSGGISSRGAVNSSGSGRGRGGRGFVLSLLRRDGAGRGTAAAAAVMDGASGVSAASPLKSSVPAGSRGLMRRLLSRSKLRRSIEASFTRPAAAAAPVAATEALASAAAVAPVAASAGATAPATPAEAVTMVDAERISADGGVESIL